MTIFLIVTAWLSFGVLTYLLKRTAARIDGIWKVSDRNFDLPMCLIWGPLTLAVAIASICEIAASALNRTPEKGDMESKW